MFSNDILIVTGQEALALLENRELEIIQTVADAYQVHGGGDSSLPHSLFLRFPDNEQNRIIALPAYLGGETRMAGIKWVSSFPNNHELNLNRASAVVILNSMETGRPISILEGSVISAKRTAASAALAAQRLQPEDKSTELGLIGCGLINFEVARFVLAACPEVKTLILFDHQRSSAERFREQCREQFAEIDVVLANDVNDVLRTARLVSLATTASKPHIFDLQGCGGSTLLHVSLRDLSPEIMLIADNVVDDIDHVCRAGTSINLAEQLVGNRDFIRCTLADVLSGAAPSRKGRDRPVIFSPFGLGVLDIALSKLVYDLAVKEKQGTSLGSFLPDYWMGAPQTKVATAS